MDILFDYQTWFTYLDQRDARPNKFDPLKQILWLSLSIQVTLITSSHLYSEKKEYLLIDKASTERGHHVAIEVAFVAVSLF